MADWKKALSFYDDDNTIHNLIAWILATSADPKVRDGKRAIDLAIGSCETTEWEDAEKIETLAAAYAEAGDFERAVEFENKAITLMTPDSDSIEDSYARLKLYEAHQPYRESSGSE